MTGFIILLMAVVLLLVHLQLYPFALIVLIAGVLVIANEYKPAQRAPSQAPQLPEPKYPGYDFWKKVAEEAGEAMGTVTKTFTPIPHIINAIQGGMKKAFGGEKEEEVKVVSGQWGAQVPVHKNMPKAQVIQTLSQQLVELEGQLAQLYQARAQIQQAGGDTTVIDAEIAQLQGVIQQIRNQINNLLK